MLGNHQKTEEHNIEQISMNHRETKQEDMYHFARI